MTVSVLLAILEEPVRSLIGKKVKTTLKNNNNNNNNLVTVLYMFCLCPLIVLRH